MTGTDDNVVSNAMRQIEQIKLSKEKEKKLRKASRKPVSPFSNMAGKIESNFKKQITLHTTVEDLQNR